MTDAVSHEGARERDGVSRRLKVDPMTMAASENDYKTESLDQS